jgi:hypothetical protein
MTDSIATDPEKDDTAYTKWLARHRIDAASTSVDMQDKDSASGQGSDAPVETFPAEYVRRAVLDHLADKLKVRSGLRFERCEVTGDMHLENLKLEFPIYFHECKFTGNLFVWRMNCETFSLNGSEVEGSIDLRTSKIDGHLLMRDGFSCKGPILARDLNVTGMVDLSDSSLLYDGNKTDKISKEIYYAANGNCFGFSRSRAKALYWRELRGRPCGVVSFRDATVGAFEHTIGKDGWEQSWPEPGKLTLDGFRYERFTSCTPEDALKWIALQNPVMPSSYAALASAFDAEHSPGKVEEVLAKAKRAEIDAMSQPLRRWFNRAVFFLVGYGRVPERAFWILALVFLFHLGLVYFVSWLGFFHPTTNSFLLEPCFLGPGGACTLDIANWTAIKIRPEDAVRYLPPAYPEFSPMEFALESFFPVFDFGQRDYWEASTFLLRAMFSLTSALGFFVGGVFLGGITGIISPRPRK